MTTIEIKVKGVDAYRATKTIPFGILTSLNIKDNTVQLKARSRANAYNAAQNFIWNFNGQFEGMKEITNKKEVVIR